MRPPTGNTHIIIHPAYAHSHSHCPTWTPLPSFQRPKRQQQHSLADNKQKKRVCLNLLLVRVENHEAETSPCPLYPRRRVHSGPILPRPSPWSWKHAREEPCQSLVCGALLFLVWTYTLSVNLLAASLTSFILSHPTCSPAVFAAGLLWACLHLRLRLRQDIIIYPPPSCPHPPFPSFSFPPTAGLDFFLLPHPTGTSRSISCLVQLNGHTSRVICLT